LTRRRLSGKGAVSVLVRPPFSTLRQELEEGRDERCRIATWRIVNEVRKGDLTSPWYAPADPCIDELVVGVRLLSVRDERPGC
jgi:hypothetical protein